MKGVFILFLIFFLAGCYYSSDIEKYTAPEEVCSFGNEKIECSNFSFNEVQADMVLKNNYDYDIKFDSLLIFSAGTCGREFFGDEKAYGYIIKKGESAKLSLICNSLPEYGEKLESEMSFRFIRQDNDVLTTILGSLVAK